MGRALTACFGNLGAGREAVSNDGYPNGRREEAPGWVLNKMKMWIMLLTPFTEKAVDF